MIDMRKTRGVTLIELLVGILIIGMIVTSVYTAFNSGRASWQVGETMVQRYQNARAALDMMSREISAMYIATSNIYRTGLIYDNETTIASFRFVARIPGSTGDSDVCIIAYRYDEGDEEIERAIDINPDLTSTGFDDPTYINGLSSWQPLVSNIKSDVEGEEPLEFRCWDEFADSPKDEWDSTPGGSEVWKIPKAVQIIIRAQDENNLAAAQSFYTVVYLPGSKQNE